MFYIVPGPMSAVRSPNGACGRGRADEVSRHSYGAKDVRRGVYAYLMEEKDTKLRTAGVVCYDCSTSEVC